MKKNFLKNLAGVLSLAMVVSSVAPATAGAATLKAFALNRNSLVVYLQHEVYAKQFNLEVAKLADNAVTWTSSNKAVAAVSQYGNVVGKKVGTAYVTLKKAGYATKKVKVTVRDLAETVTIATTPKDSKIAVGESFDFNAKVVGFAGGASSEKTKWTVSDPTVATITAAGIVTPLKAGKFDVVATAGKATAKLTVTAVDRISAVSQKSYNTINVVFSGVVKDVVKASDFTVKNADTLVKQAVKAVTFSVDGKTAYVELYTDLVNEKNYEVTYGDSSKTLVANAGVPVSVTVTGKEITFNTATAVDIKLLDANGVDVTSTANMAKVTVTVDKGYYNNADKKLTLYSVGDVSALKATYHTYTYGTDGKEVVYEASATFTAVKEAAKEVSSITSTITKTTADWANVTNTVALEDTGYKLVAKTVYTDKAEQTTLDLVNPLKLESTDTSKLIIGTAGELLPVAAGVVVVKVKSGDTVVGTVNVTVGAKRVAYSVQLDKTSITLSSSAAASDVQKVKITVKDQYGVVIDNGSNAVVVSPAASTGAEQISAGTLREVTFTGANFTTAGTYTYTIKYKDMAQSLTVVAKAPSTLVSPSSIRLSLSDTEKDLVYKTTDTAAAIAVDVNLFSYDASGVKIANVTAGYTYDVKKADGTEVVTGAALTTNFDLRTLAGTVITQKAADTYTVIAKNILGAVVDTATIKVTNTQVAPVVAQKTNKVTATVSSTTDANVIACFAAKLNGNDATISSFTYSSVPGGNAILVKTVIVPETIGSYTINHEVTVNAIVYLP